MTNLRLASENDANLLREISLKAFKEDYEKYGEYPPGIDSVDWHKSQMKNSDYYKIEFDNEIVGGINLAFIDDNHVEVELFYISPDHQNKKIGGTTMKFIEDKYPDIEKWSLVTPYKDYRNHHFYEKLGYKKVGEYRPEPESDFVLFKYLKKSSN